MAILKLFGVSGWVGSPALAGIWAELGNITLKAKKTENKKILQNESYQSTWLNLKRYFWTPPPCCGNISCREMYAAMIIWFFKWIDYGRILSIFFSQISTVSDVISYRIWPILVCLRWFWANTGTYYCVNVLNLMIIFVSS